MKIVGCAKAPAHLRNTRSSESRPITTRHQVDLLRHSLAVGPYVLEIWQGSWAGGTLAAWTGMAGALLKKLLLLGLGLRLRLCGVGGTPLDDYVNKPDAHYRPDCRLLLPLAYCCASIAVPQLLLIINRCCAAQMARHGGPLAGQVSGGAVGGRGAQHDQPSVAALACRPPPLDALPRPPGQSPPPPPSLPSLSPVASTDCHHVLIPVLSPCPSQKPKRIHYDTAFLLIGGGSNTGQPLTATDELLLLAAA